MRHAVHRFERCCSLPAAEPLPPLLHDLCSTPLAPPLPLPICSDSTPKRARAGPGDVARVRAGRGERDGPPPRNIATDRLVSLPLLIYSYIIMGLAESLCCLGAYLWVFTIRGVDHADIFLVDPKKNIWDSRAERNENIAPGGFNESQQANIVRQVRVPTPAHRA